MGTSSRWEQLRVLAVVPSLLITAVGRVACFQANRRGDNRAFLERYVCLSLPVGLVTYAVYYLLYYGMGLVGFGAGWVNPDASNWDSTAMALVAFTQQGTGRAAAWRPETTPLLHNLTRA